MVNVGRCTDDDGGGDGFGDTYWRQLEMREGHCGDNAAMKSRGGNGGKKVVLSLRAGPASCATIECSFHRRRHGEW